ncbi:jg25647 [Pararge aegeria aegeria]|uniref:Jg25647 protein n=1 Tax=Pararge aegeria aegeria TaxID=348720 RepID=A0A8S4QYZ6_9NEOP|nr:jg25647 [Pararge aegeria aegeria]
MLRFRSETCVEGALPRICLVWSIRIEETRQRVKDERWSYIVTNWYPRDSKRRRGRPLRRWSDDITQIAGKTWARAAMDRKSWLLMEEAFTAKCGPYNKY